jgi:hypothetical protein
MATGSRLTDDQCMGGIKAIQKYGSLKAASEATGISRSTLRSRVEEAKRRKLDAPSEPDIILPDFPSADLPIEKILDMMEERSQLRIQSYEAHTWFPVKVRDTKPIGILWFGDPHIDDNGCDIKLLRHYARLCKNTDGLYGANIGDTTNNWSGRLAALYAKQDTSLKTARRMAEWFMLDSGIRWLLWLIGNHDAWGDGAEILAMMGAKHKTQKVVCHDWEARFVLRFPNGVEVRVNAAHDFAGNSMWNPLHGAVKAAKQGDKIDLLVCGHKHNWAISQWEMAAQQIIPTMIRVKGFKTYDDYAMRLGHYEQKEGSAILTIIDPAKEKSGRVTPFVDVDAGAEYLSWLRARS